METESCRFYDTGVLRGKLDKPHGLDDWNRSTFSITGKVRAIICIPLSFFIPEAGFLMASRI